MHQVEGVQQLGRHRHGAVDTLAAFLQALEHDDSPRQVDLLRRQGQGFGNPAPCRVQHAAEGADLARGLLLRLRKLRLVSERPHHVSAGRR